MAVIAFEGVSKRFVLHHERPRSFQELLVSTFQRRDSTREEFWALRDVDFDVGSGETFGLVGRNGSGKSTALKLITRILEPTAGRVTVRGKVSALIELGAGFHPDLTGRENVYLLGSIMGLSGKAMSRRFDAIVEFAELEQFIDTPVKHYSSGMYMRLGFATAINVDADILLIDEVLAVGDQEFQAKCYGAIAAFQRQGITMVMVSHDLGLIEQFCGRAIYLRSGLVAAQGAARDVIGAYLGAAKAEALRP